MPSSGFSVATPRGPVAGEITGSGSPLVLISGLGSTRRIWGELPRLLGRHFTVIALDNRGVGGSRAHEPFTLGGAAADVVAVLDAHGIPVATLLGASMGGLIALATVIDFPERVGAVVLASTAAHVSRHGRRALELLRDLLLHLPPERVGPTLMTLAFAPPFHERYAGLVEEVSELYGICPEDVPGALAQAAHLLQGWDLRPRLHKLEVPALVITGVRDPLVAAEDTAALADALPGARLERLGDAAHSVLAEGGEALLQRLMAFLGRAAR